MTLCEMSFAAAPDLMTNQLVHPLQSMAHVWAAKAKLVARDNRFCMMHAVWLAVCMCLRDETPLEWLACEWAVSMAN
jgi:hypothetical protein